ncbi:MAG: glycosyltransferase [Gemmatimonadaceae bacterium]|nr:glycosyltransferase [Gemmatimonadaceae bacterium]
MTDPRTAPQPSARPQRRVLVFMDSGTPSGPVKQLAATIRPLADAGYALHCVVFQRRGTPAVTSEPYLRAHGATTSLVHDSGAFDLRLLGAVARVIREFRPDLVQTHGYRPSVLMALLRKSGTIRDPWIGFFHGRTAESFRVRMYDKLDHIALRASDVAAVMSALQKREKAGYRRAEVRIVYNAVIESARKAPPAHEVALVKGPWARPAIGVIGRLSPEKGVDVLLEAWAVLVRDGTAGTLLIAGDGQERGRLEEQARTLAIADRVHFLGHLEAPDLLYPELDLMVIPSRTEGLPNVFLEALRHGIPVVSTRVGAIPDLVGDTAIARLVHIEDPAALAAAIAATLANPEDRAPDAAAELVRSLSLPARVAALTRLYEDVLSRAGRS